MDRTDFPLFVLYFSPSFPFSPINSSHSLSFSLFLCFNRGISLYLWCVDCIAVQQRVAPCSYFNYVNSWLRIVVLEQLCRVDVESIPQSRTHHGRAFVSFDIIANHFGSILASMRKRSLCTRHARVFPRNFVHRLIANVRIRSNDMKFLRTKLSANWSRFNSSSRFFLFMCRQYK